MPRFVAFILSAITSLLLLASITGVLIRADNALARSSPKLISGGNRTDSASKHHKHHKRPQRHSRNRESLADADYTTIQPGQRIANSFMGISIEYNTLRTLEGSDPQVNPLLGELFSNLASQGASPLDLRIGGNSSDLVWWSPPSSSTPPFSHAIILHQAFLDKTRQMLASTPMPVTLGLNLADNLPEKAAEFVLAAKQTLPDNIRFELGNEPDLFDRVAWFTDDSQNKVQARSHYSLGNYLNDVARFYSTLRGPLGSSNLEGPSFGSLRWVKNTRTVIRQRVFSQLTFHRYPLSTCLHLPRYLLRPSIRHLLSEEAVSWTAKSLAPALQVSKANSIPLRVDELNSVSCGGTKGVSDTFASALWALDQSFTLAKAGVSGVNFHTVTNTVYSPFTLQFKDNHWQGQVLPLYYALAFFQRAVGPGAHLVNNRVTEQSNVKVWTTVDQKHTVRVSLINKSAHSGSVRLRLKSTNPATLIRMTAPSLSAKTVTLAGENYSIANQHLETQGLERSEAVISNRGTYEVKLPAYSAALMTVRK